jgi:hypothetical protein
MMLGGVRKKASGTRCVCACVLFEVKKRTKSIFEKPFLDPQPFQNVSACVVFEEAGGHAPKLHSSIYILGMNVKVGLCSDLAMAHLCLQQSIKPLL